MIVDPPETVFPLPLWFVLAVTILFGCTGCAPQRYLTAEQDAEMAAACGEGGCTVMPNAVFQQMRVFLQQCMQ